MIKAPSLLFLDIKTSGLYRTTEPLTSDQQPWAPYIAALQCDSTGRVVNHFATFVKAEGRSVKNGALEIHGIDHKAADRVGVPQPRALGLLTDMLKVGPIADTMKVITFGDMDKMVIASLLARFAEKAGKPVDSYSRLWMARPHTTFIDLQKPWAQRLCRLPSPDGEGDFRWPTFEEACTFALGRSAKNALDGLEDLLLLKDLYFNFAGRGYFPDTEAA
jgi:hypothetical protein